MKRKRITIMWMPSVSSKSRTFSLPVIALYIFVGMLLLSWALLATGGYFGNRLYHDYTQVREKNTHLLQKERELDALRQTMERIQQDENTIRSFLGLGECRCAPNRADDERQRARDGAHADAVHEFSRLELMRCSEKSSNARARRRRTLKVR